MQEPEMVVIQQSQSLWLKIGGWLPIVVIMGIFVFVTLAIQSAFNDYEAGKVATSVNTSGGATWKSWVPLFVTMFFVLAGIVTAWTKRETLKEQQWWKEKEKNPDDKKWFWYIIVLIVTITASAVSPAEHRYTVAMIVALLGLHVVWLFLITEKISTVTKVVITAFLLFFIAAGLLPGTDKYFSAKWRVVKKDVADAGAEAKSYADDYEKEITSTVVSAQQSVVIPAVYQLVTLPPQTLQVIPGEGFKKVSIPPGRILKDVTWKCPDGCILEIVHDGHPLCPVTNIYQGIPCGSLPSEVSNVGTTRYREQFATPYGKFLSFPRDIVVVGVAFGTDAILGPIEVTATVTL